MRRRYGTELVLVRVCCELIQEIKIFFFFPTEVKRSPVRVSLTLCSFSLIVYVCMHVYVYMYTHTVEMLWIHKEVLNSDQPCLRKVLVLSPLPWSWLQKVSSHLQMTNSMYVSHHFPLHFHSPTLASSG